VTPAAPARAERLSPGAVRLLLGFAYLAAAAFYAWQASKRPSPTIFSDEIEFAQISRSIAEDGRPSIRGEPHAFQSLYTYLVAPAWWFDDPQRAWEAAKFIGVLVMTSALFPAYGLARLVVSRPWALAAAVGAVATPPLAYAPYLLREPLAYPVSTLGLWVVARAVAQPSGRRLFLAAGICLLAPLVRGELGILLLVYAAGLAALLWRTAGFRRWRTTWTTGDWLGGAVLLTGVAVVASAALGHRSDAWYTATGFFKQRTVEHGLWSTGAMAIGLGVLPLLALVAVLLSARVRATENGRGFVVVAAAACAGYVVYAGVKGAFLSTNFSTLIVERNVIYLVPIAAAATMVVLSRAEASAPALVAALVLALTLISQAQLKLDQYPYFEAPSLAIGALANRNFAWDDNDVRRALVLVAVVSFWLLLATALVSSRRVRIGVATVTLAALGTWTITAESYASRGLNGFAERLYGSTPRPVDWIDRTTGGEPALYLGQRIHDPNGIWLMEFWNRSVKRVWSLDGSAPAPTLSPDLGAPDGTLSPSPDTRWIVTGNGVEVLGERVGEPRANASIFRVDPPVRLRYAQNGVSDDGWMSAHATYSQYAPDEGVSEGFARIILSRQGACGDAFPTSTVVVRVGTVVVRDQQPALGRVSEEVRRRLAPCALETVVVRAKVPFHVDVTVSPTFVPAEVDPSSGDVRELGAQVAFGFLPKQEDG